MISAVDEPAEPTPMFSPAEVHGTPWALNRSPMPPSRGHWCSSPQPLIINWLCRADAFDSLRSRTYPRSPAFCRAALMSASTARSTASPVDGGGPGSAGGCGLGFGLGFGAALDGCGLGFGLAFAGAGRPEGTAAAELGVTPVVAGSSTSPVVPSPAPASG